MIYPKFYFGFAAIPSSGVILLIPAALPLMNVNFLP